MTLFWELPDYLDQICAVSYTPDTITLSYWAKVISTIFKTFELKDARSLSKLEFQFWPKCGNNGSWLLPYICLPMLGDVCLVLSSVVYKLLWVRTTLWCKYSTHTILGLARHQQPSFRQHYTIVQRGLKSWYFYKDFQLDLILESKRIIEISECKVWINFGEHKKYCLIVVIC